MRKILLSVMTVVVSVVLCIGAMEAALRLKNGDMRNYDIEMWRYARLLKRASADKTLGHEHVPSATAELQSVTIRTNELGLRGGPVRSPKPPRRILVLGSSVALGWGVAEEQTMAGRLAAMFKIEGRDVEVLNAGIGNYNAPRYVNLFLGRLTSLEPTDIVVQYFLRDAEELDRGRNNPVLRESQLAATVWLLFNRALSDTGEGALTRHYQKVYHEGAPGFKAMRDALGELAAYAKKHGIHIYLAMTPDIHNLSDYRFGFIHKIMRRIAEQQGYIFVDFLDHFVGRDPNDLWAMPGDPHPNALGHDLMAQALYPVLVGQDR